MSGLLGGPVSWVCYVFIAAVLLGPLVAKLVRRGRGRDDDRPGGDSGGPSAGVELDRAATLEGPGS